MRKELARRTVSRIGTGRQHVTQISKRLRYEILRRDNHSCRYCGATAPTARLTIDHVVPVALGGTDDPANLVAACADCNNGKSASNPDAPLVEDVSADALRWGRAMRLAAETLQADLRERTAAQDRLAAAWDEWRYGSQDDPQPLPMPADWRNSFDALLAAGLTEDVLTECINIAGGARHVSPDKTFRYMCGIAWRKVGELREIAGALIEADPEP